MHRARAYRATILVTVLLVVLSGMPRAVAQTTPRPPPVVAPATFGAVIGTAWKGDTTPYPRARIRLRNVETGRAVARTVSDANGRFHFERVESGVYVVELASDEDKVLAVGDLFSVTVGDPATTLVRLSSKAPWVAGFFGNAAAAVIAAAATLGVTGVGSNGNPASGQ